MMNSVAIITARGGSKRIPRKNIKEFCGKPIIAYSIEAAIKSDLFDEVMVSTDDAEIKSVAEGYGAVTPFLRSEATSNDYATTTDVLMEVLENYQALGKQFDSFCCIYPTAPMITSDMLQDVMSLLYKENADSAIPVVKFSFQPQRGFMIRDDKIELAYPEHFEKRSQDLEPMYHDCGMFYCARTGAFINNKALVTRNTVPYILPEEVVQDIDTVDDWKTAELKFKLLKGGVT